MKLIAKQLAHFFLFRVFSRGQGLMIKTHGPKYIRTMYTGKIAACEFHINSFHVNFMWNFHVKFIWKNSREFHFYWSIQMKNFTWNSREFHVKFTCGDFACVGLISCTVLTNADRRLEVWIPSVTDLLLKREWWLIKAISAYGDIKIKPPNKQTMH